jgi:hypothetical protein
MPETAPVPTPERKPAWRAAAVAYREQRRAGATDHASWVAAVEAILAVWPILLDDAKREATLAIAYASANHTQWSWDGVGGSE